MTRKLLTIITALFVALSVIPVGVSAESVTTESEDSTIQIVPECAELSEPESVRETSEIEETQKKILVEQHADLLATQNGTAYAVLTADGSLVFCRSNNNYNNNSTADVIDIKGNHVKGTVFTGFESLVAKADTEIPWDSARESIKSVKVNAGQKIYPISMGWWFYDCINMKTADVSGFDTSNVTDMFAMFYNCTSLTSLDVSHFNTSKVTNMAYVFGATNYKSMQLKKLDVSRFDTGNVTSMYGMFWNCVNLTNLDVSHFNTSKVTNMAFMFGANGSNMQLNDLDVSHFDTSNVTNMKAMFHRCLSLTSLNLNNFDTSKVTDMNFMFLRNLNLTFIYVSEKWSTATVTDSEYMFYNCISLPNYYSKATDKTHAHYGEGGYLTYKPNPRGDGASTPVSTPAKSDVKAGQFNYSNQQYEGELAEFCAKYSALIYSDYFMRENYFYNVDGADNGGLTYSLALDNFGNGPVYYNDGSNENDGVTFALASKWVSHNGEVRPLLFVVIRGTDNKQWYGNFNVASKPYDGNRPDNHYSFKNGADIIKRHIESYVSGKKLNNPIVLITGHSRGAGIGNILAKELTEGAVPCVDSSKIYAYLFAVPNTTINPVKYKNINNFCFNDDFVTQLPLESWGYMKNGMMYTAYADWNYANNTSFQNREYLSLKASSKTGAEKTKSVADSLNKKLFDSLEVEKVIRYVQQTDRWDKLDKYYNGIECRYHLEKYTGASLYDFMYGTIAAAAQRDIWNKVLGKVEAFDTKNAGSYLKPVAEFFVDGASQRKSIMNTHQMYTYYNALVTGIFKENKGYNGTPVNIPNRSTALSQVMDDSTDDELIDEYVENSDYLEEEIETLTTFANTGNNQELLWWDLNDPETWEGIKFDNKRVIEIQLGRVGLSGTLDLSKFANLRTISIAKNDITSLILPDPSISVLSWLDCKGNDLEKLDISGQQLVLLDCTDNYLNPKEIQQQIDDIFFLSYNEQKTPESVTYYQNDIAVLRTILKNDEIWNLNDNCNTWHGVTWDEIDGVYRVVSLDISECKLSGSLDVSGLTHLAKLECSDNSFTSLNGDNCHQLCYVNCCNNELTSLSLNGVSDELMLFCSYNHLNLNDIDKINTVLSLVDHQAIETDATEFEQNEYTELKAIAELNLMDIQKPGTWEFVQWKQINGKYRAIKIDFDAEYELVDRLDLSMFEYLEEFYLIDSPIKEIILPKNLAVINDCAFYGCKQLEKVVIPSTLKEIHEGAFENCSVLKEIGIPLSLNKVDMFAFDGCDSLEKVIYEGTKNEWEAISIEEGNEPLINAELICAEGSGTDPVSIKVVGSEIIDAGETAQFTADLQPDNAIQSVTWKSSDEKIATVDQSGRVKGIKPGYATITATTANGLTASCQIRVLFTDIPAEGKYYSAPVYWAVEKGITNGYTDSDGIIRTFKPQNNCTREAVVTFLWRLAGRPDPKDMNSPFSDVQDRSKYYYKAVLWAAELGITKGYQDGTFKPNATCLREHVVTFLYRYAGQPSIGVSKNPFNDISSSDYYYKPVLWAVNRGITNGYSSGPNAGGFGPKLDCLREHVVTFLYRYAK